MSNVYVLVKVNNKNGRKIEQILGVTKENKLRKFCKKVLNTYGINSLSNLVLYCCESNQVYNDDLLGAYIYEFDLFEYTIEDKMYLCLGLQLSGLGGQPDFVFLDNPIIVKEL